MCQIYCALHRILVSLSNAHHMVSYLDQDWCKHHFHDQQKSGIKRARIGSSKLIEPCGLKIFGADQVRLRQKYFWADLSSAGYFFG